MKKTLLFFTLVLCGIFTDTSAQIEKPLRLTVTFSFNIAAPRQDCNSGFGLCFTGVSLKVREVNAGITIVGNTLNIYISRTQIDPQLENELMGLSAFPIVAGTVIPLEIARRAGLHDEIALIPGQYPMLISDEYFIIPCRMEE